MFNDMKALETDNFIDDLFKKAYDLGQVKLHSTVDAVGYTTFDGVTVCQLEREDRSVASVGYAFCSDNDNFNKKTGRNIALARAIQWVNRKV